MTVKITWTADQWARAIIPAINAGLTAAAQVCADQAVQSFGSSPSPPGSPPGVDTGLLRNSIAVASPEALGTPLKAAFGTAVPYGRHLEFGAVVRPKKAKALAIPNDRGAGQAIIRQFGKGASLRGNSNLRFIPMTKFGFVGVLVNKKMFSVHVRGIKGTAFSGGGTRKIPKGSIMFFLRTQVTIAPRPWIMRAANAARAEAGAAANKTMLQRMRQAGLVK